MDFAEHDYKVMLSPPTSVYSWAPARDKTAKRLIAQALVRRSTVYTDSSMPESLLS